MQKNDDRIRLISARIMAGVLVAALCVLAMRFATRQILVKRMHMDNAVTQLILKGADELKDRSHIAVGWAARYPFKDAGDEPRAQRGGGLLSAKDKLLNLWDELKTTAELYTGEYFPLRYRLAEQMNGYQKLLGWEINPVNGYNNVITLKDGFLAGCVPRMDMREHARAVQALAETVRRHGGRFLYVQIPSKISASDADVSGILDFSNRNADELLQRLSDNGIETLDLREKARQNGMDRASMFYRTDHHWKGETGLWAAGEVMRYLNARHAWGADNSLLESSRYTYRVEKNIMLGAQGKKVTLSRTAPEDFTLIYPDFDTDLRLVIPSRDIDSRGNFDVLYDYTSLTGEDVYHKMPYAAYLYGENALTRITNERNEGQKKMLVISESNDNCMTPFMALVTRQTDAIDPRQFTGSLEGYLAENAYDTVILAYAAASIGEIETRSHTNLFDFR